MAAEKPLQLLRPTEAAKVLACHPQHLANLRHQGLGPEFVKLGAAVRYSTESLAAYVAEHTCAPKAAR